MYLVSPNTTILWSRFAHISTWNRKRWIIIFIHYLNLFYFFQIKTFFCQQNIYWAALNFKHCDLKYHTFSIFQDKGFYDEIYDFGILRSVWKSATPFLNGFRNVFIQQNFSNSHCVRNELKISPVHCEILWET